MKNIILLLLTFSTSIYSFAEENSKIDIKVECKKDEYAAITYIKRMGDGLFSVNATCKPAVCYYVRSSLLTYEIYRSQDLIIDSVSKYAIYDNKISGYLQKGLTSKQEAAALAEAYRRDGICQKIEYRNQIFSNF